ncbi:MAG: hypothetical protein HOP28_13665 [Gemmatimonadales bacterium]|nr:hypothetical protein [Gemmatimonadales bacterium]
MRVSTRLFLAVIPAILGLLTVAALAYWGNMYRRAPEWLVIIAALAAVGSLIVAWQNTRYVARRIERLAGSGRQNPLERTSALAAVRDAARPGPGTSPDEIDSIEEVVDRLSGAVTMAEAGSREREAMASQRVQEYAALLAEAASAVSRQLDEVRLPIHILLENHFGQLNENQEEMLAAARAAAEAADIELRRLKEITELDRGALNLRRDRVKTGDLLKAIEAQLRALAERAGATLTLDVAPGLPRIAGDRVRLQEAVELLLQHLVRRAMAGSELTIRVGAEEGRVVLEMDGAPAPTLDADVALARRIILAHGGTLETQGGRTQIAFPTLPNR